MDNNEMNNSGVGENPSDVNATVDSHYAGTTQDAGILPIHIPHRMQAHSTE